ncbi:hypothetical protein [Novosphingobium sp. SG707]|uniref:hypothetical protein n=1 Tax=Novosphingobium sp. SG707 TaxID=2586996 RepID=UPI00144712DE|nr:hypothetical protein [Novosphingobium sp. SG707]NKJ00913.1 hypothetical protein [Novosphingobium sp. SG707]
MRRQRIAARKDKMTLMHTGAFKRHTNSPRKNSAAGETMGRYMTSTAMLSPLELRRIVAAMVD